jgi:hypothetical protein
MIPNPYQQKPSPESVLLDILSRKPGITSKEAYAFFLDKYEAGMSVQGFYKILRQLLGDRVIAKTDGRLSLYSAWVNNLMKFAKQAALTHLDANASPVTIILEEGEKKSFEFDTPIEMSTFWDHALLTVAYHYKDNQEPIDKNAYSKNFYSWIQLLRTSDEAQLINLYSDLEMDWSMASGSKSLLNRLVSQIYNEKNFHFTIYPELTGYGVGRNNFHVTVIGDFIFETKLPEYIFKDIQRMFESVRNLPEFNVEEMQKVVLQTGKTVLTITRNAKRAADIRKEIKSLFKK